LFGLWKWEDKKGDIHVDCSEKQPTLAHVDADGITLDGTLEPMISREWRESQNGKEDDGPGRKITRMGLGYVPCVMVSSDIKFAIGHFGIWKPV
jgi:hypothetical protein